MIGVAALRALCALSCAVVLAAQESRPEAASPQRRPILGRVLDEQGNPCVGASVTLYGTQPFWIERAGDTVMVVADERGRFVAKVLPSVPTAALRPRRLARMVP